MPCLSWLVNARNRGVRGSGPPGFRRGLDATDRAFAVWVGGEKCPRAAVLVAVWAIVAAYRDRSPARLLGARRVGDSPRSSTRHRPAGCVMALANGDLAPGQ